MLPRRPRLRLDPSASSQSYSGPPLSFVSPSGPPSSYSTPPSSFASISAHPASGSRSSLGTRPHTSTFRSLQMEIHIDSPSVKTIRRPGDAKPRTLPVFSDRDTVAGKVMLSRDCAHTGRLVISFEGSFTYISPIVDRHRMLPEDSGKRKHVFLSSSTTIPLSISEASSPRTQVNIREALAATSRRLGRRPSLPTLTDVTTGLGRTFPFNFQLPRSAREGEELPSSFSSSTVTGAGVHTRAEAETIEVQYRVTAVWESQDTDSNRILLDAPVLFQPDKDFSSLDGLPSEPESWLEMPLRSDRQIPFHCAVTLPNPASVPRSGSIPYYVVFTTSPRSSSLAREIASDATITVTLLRVIQTSRSHGLPTPPPTPPSATELSDPGSQTHPPPTTRLLKRVTRNGPPILGGMRFSRVDPDENQPMQIRSLPNELFSRKDKPLPQIPPDNASKSFSETRTLQTDVCIGFPKRPRAAKGENQKHPSLDRQKALPDGLYKGKMQLNKGMAPGIDWAGLAVEYYMEVSVSFGQDDLRVRAPIRIL